MARSDSTMSRGRGRCDRPADERPAMETVLDGAAATPGRVVLRLAPLDIPLDIECAPPAADAVAAACVGWEADRGGWLAPLRLRIRASGSLCGTGGARACVDGSRMTLRGPGIAARADVAEGVAECAVSADCLNDPVALRQEVIEPLALMMLTHRDRTPLHASAFVVDGLAILLAGRTGAGKSCLARAADVAGYQVLSDDTVFVQLAPRLKVWGWPSAAHLLPEDALDRAGPTRLRNGKVKQIVPLRSASCAAIACDRAVLCLLSPGLGEAPTLKPAPAGAIDARLWPLDEGFDLLPLPIARALARLSAGGVWDLRLSHDPAEAVQLLIANLPRLSRSAAA